MDGKGGTLLGYVIRKDGKYYQGCGYGGPGHPVPYWSEDYKLAKIYRQGKSAAEAAERFGGEVYLARRSEERPGGEPELLKALPV